LIETAQQGIKKEAKRQVLLWKILTPVSFQNQNKRIQVVSESNEVDDSSLGQSGKLLDKGIVL
jgi:hypothetical protein